MCKKPVTAIIFHIIISLFTGLTYSQTAEWSNELNGFVMVLNSKDTAIAISLKNPGITNIKIQKEFYKSDSVKFASDVIVQTAENDDALKSCSYIAVKGQVAFLAGPFSGKMSSIVGLPPTRLEISMLKDGIYYDSLKWFPTAETNCFIICLKDEIIGVNVKTNLSHINSINKSKAGNGAGLTTKEKNKPAPELSKKEKAFQKKLADNELARKTLVDYNSIGISYNKGKSFLLKYPGSKYCNDVKKLCNSFKIINFPDEVFIKYADLKSKYHWNEDKKTDVHPSYLETEIKTDNYYAYGDWSLGNLEFIGGVSLEQEGVKIAKGTILCLQQGEE